eukprot:Awhi_evm1s8145
MYLKVVTNSLFSLLGAPMGCAPMTHLLWTRHMNYNPANPKWFNRDRFVLSNGHACALQYTMLHLAGYNVTQDDLKAFRQLGSKCPGHPENTDTEGIEVTTGPLGQGIANAVGLAMAEKHFAARFNKPDHEIVNNRVYCILGDGCHQEGVSAEAASLAGHLKLNNLICLYDDNKIQIDGSTDLAFTEDVAARYRSYGWNTLDVAKGDTDLGELDAAIEEAKKSDKPTLISVHTVIGYGSKMEGTHSVHGAALKPDDLAQVKEKFGFSGDDKFFVPDEVKEFYAARGAAGAAKEKEWNAALEAYKAAFPTEGAELERRITGALPVGWKDALPRWTSEDKPLATRQTSQKVLNAIAAAIPEVVGGSADLTPSNLTNLDCSHDFQPDSYDGRYFRFGVREHGMAAICNGLAAYGGLIPFGATFFNFIGYALGAVRLSAISHFRMMYIMTHDSIGLGEDGPTHQPINSLAMLRAMPNILTFRPCDGNETSGSYAAALENENRPSVLVFTRQGLPQQALSTVENVLKGGYIIHDSPDFKVTFVASGSEVACAIDAAKALPFGARVVSMPCTTLFDEQSTEYKLSLFPDGIPVISVEALSTKGWHEYSHVQHGMTTFGKSGTGKALFDYFGFNAATLSGKAEKVVEYYSSNPVPSLFNRPQF